MTRERRQIKIRFVFRGLFSIVLLVPRCCTINISMTNSEPFMLVTFVASTNSGFSTSAFSSDYTIVPVKDSFSVFITVVVIIRLRLKKWCRVWMMDVSSNSTNFLAWSRGACLNPVCKCPTAFCSCKMDYWRVCTSALEGATLSRAMSLRG